MVFKKILIYCSRCNKLLIKGGAIMKKLFANLFVCFAILVSASGYQVQAETAANVVLSNGEFQTFSKELPDLPSRP